MMSYKDQVYDHQTIIAQCTPSGPGALALIRISGPQAILIADNMSKLGSGKKLINLPSHTIHYGFIRNQDGSPVDQVLFLLMRNPRTFTGEDTIEITCHNNQFIIEQIIQLAITQGARLARGGEFTQQAVENNKIDLLQAEAIHELIHAQTEYALKYSLAQLEGSLSFWIVSLENKLYKALALSEASFEFLDEENLEFGSDIANIIQDVLEKINEIKISFGQQKHIRDGIRIALVGSVNAGKSSLFNALLKKNRAIVNAQAGTTRDSIEAGIYKKNSFWTLIDTAGLRQTDDAIEQEGIRRSFEQAHLADIIIVVYDGSRITSPEEEVIYNKIISDYNSKIIRVFNKSDMLPELYTQESTALYTSTKTTNNILELERILEEKTAELLTASTTPFLLNKRHFNSVLDLEKKLLSLLPQLTPSHNNNYNNTIQYELVSLELRDILEHLSQMTGRTVSERGMDTVFREFCVGK